MAKVKLPVGHIETTEEFYVKKVKNEKMITRIRQIAEYFNFSVPTAQKIKNGIPKDQYSQKVITPILN